MNRSSVFLYLLAGAALLTFGCSNKSSQEACQNQATLDLDAGRYDSVLASSCSDFLQRGAANFGKAGFDTSSVLNAFIDGKNTSSAPLSIYMNNLVDRATNTTIDYLDAALTDYGSVSGASDNYRNAQFDVSLVSTMKGLALLRLFITAESPDAFVTACDVNRNNRADSIDAAGCALAASAGQSCGADSTVTIVPNLTLQGIAGTYRGSLTRISGSGSTAACPPSNEYKRLLVQNAGVWDIVTTTMQTCTEAAPVSGRTWPCPLVSSTTPAGLARAFDESLDRAINALNISVTTTGASDVRDAIIDIKKQNCCTGPEVWDSLTNNPASCTCNALDLGNYLLTL